MKHYEVVEYMHRSQLTKGLNNMVQVGWEPMLVQPYVTSSNRTYYMVVYVRQDGL